MIFEGSVVVLILRHAVAVLSVLVAGVEGSAGCFGFLGSGQDRAIKQLRLGLGVKGCSPLLSPSACNVRVKMKIRQRGTGAKMRIWSVLSTLLDRLSTYCF